MEALNRLPPKIFAKNAYISLFPPPRSTVLRPSGIGFSVSPNFKKLQYHHLVLFGATDGSFITKTQLASGAVQVLSGLDTEVYELHSSRQSKTVHLKFQVQKECRFGEQFLLVGDAPMMGLWDPSSAIPLNWSEGNMWSVELDVPVDLTMNFKFILKQNDGEIVWQPGPDRFFTSWESRNTLVIAEDWENAEAQKILEEESVDHAIEMEINPGAAMTDVDNVANQMEQVMLKDGNNARMKDDGLSASNELITAERTTHLEGGQIGKIPTAAEDKETMFSYEDGRTLVPGLTALQEMPAEDALAKELGSIIADAAARMDAGEDHKVPE
ncbi:hypothetical protein Tsubulata_003578, partial [Turnera subulata]